MLLILVINSSQPSASALRVTLMVAPITDLEVDRRDAPVSSPPEHQPELAPAAECEPAEPASDMPVYRSEELLQGRNEVWIVHAGKTYRLLRTRNQKLILVK